MFEIIRVFPTHASPYVGGYVDFDRQYTVEEFIEETLKKYPSISGSFVVDATSLVAHYRKGKLFKMKIFPEKGFLKSQGLQPFPFVQDGIKPIMLSLN